MEERFLSGLDALVAATALLQRVRLAHPTAGLLEAADLQWWWRSPRSTDATPQPFWFDEDGRSVAAVIATDWGNTVALDPIVMPGLAAARVAHVVERGLEHARASGLDDLEVVIDAADHDMRALLESHGFGVTRGEHLAVVDAWLAGEARPRVGVLPSGYRRLDRRDLHSRPHHLAERNGPAVEARLRQTSLYRADLDLVVLDDRDDVAAYGLFWFDPATAVGLVEPMRTETEHQGRGVARHLLANGVERLVAAGARRVKVCFRPSDAAARALYLGAGFEIGKEALVLARDRFARAHGDGADPEPSTHRTGRRS